MSDKQPTPAQSFSIAALLAGSQTLFPEAAAGSFNERFIHNVGANSISVNLMGNAAVAGAADTVTIAAGGTLSGIGISNAITVIGTAGQPVTAIQR